MRELEGGLDVGIAVDGTRGRWGVSEIGDAASVDVAVAAVIVIGVVVSEGVGGAEDAAAHFGKVRGDNGVFGELGIRWHPAVEPLVKGADDVWFRKFVKVGLGHFCGGWAGGRVRGGGRHCGGSCCGGCGSERSLPALSGLAGSSATGRGGEPSAAHVFAAGIDSDGVLGDVEDIT